MLKTTTTKTTYNVSGTTEVYLAVEIQNVSHTGGEIQEVVDGETESFRGVIEIKVNYYEIDALGVKTEIGGRNDLDTRIVRALKLRDDYIFGLDQTPFDGLVGYERMERTGYEFLKKHLCEKNIFGISDMAEWILE